MYGFNKSHIVPYPQIRTIVKNKWKKKKKNSNLIFIFAFTFAKGTYILWVLLDKGVWIHDHRCCCMPAKETVNYVHNLFI